MKIFCECDSTACKKQIEVSDSHVLSMHPMNYVTISKKCNHGPEPEDELVSEHETFNIYKNGIAD